MICSIFCMYSYCVLASDLWGRILGRKADLRPHCFFRYIACRKWFQAAWEDARRISQRDDGFPVFRRQFSLVIDSSGILILVCLWKAMRRLRNSGAASCQRSQRKLTTLYLKNLTSWWRLRLRIRSRQRMGDSLWQIGKKYYVSVGRIKEMNNLTEDDIKTGDKLLIVK